MPRPEAPGITVQLIPPRAALALDASHVYFGVGTAVRRCAKSGGPAATLGNAPAIARALHVRDGFVYFASGQRIQRVAVGGGAVQDIFIGSEIIRAMDLDATHIYYATTTRVARLERCACE